MKNAKVLKVQGELGRHLIEDMAEFIHSNVEEDIVILFMHTNVVLLEDYLVLIDILNFARDNCKSAKAYFYGTLNFKHVPLMKAIDSTMSNNSLMLIDKQDLVKLKLLQNKDELIEDFLLKRVQTYAYANSLLVDEELEEEDMLLTKTGCIEMGIIKG